LPLCAAPLLGQVLPGQCLEEIASRDIRLERADILLVYGAWLGYFDRLGNKFSGQPTRL